MTVPRELLCAILGHNSGSLCVPRLLEVYMGGGYADVASVQTLGDLVRLFDDYHSFDCDCGLKLSNSLVWRAEISLGEDWDTALAWYEPRNSELLDCSLSLPTVFPTQRLPEGLIHLVIGTEGRLPQRFSRNLRGLRRLGGDLCRVVGAPDLILPPTSNFRDIILRTPGSFYVDRFDWIADRYGPTFPDESVPIPIIRRPPGFGKTTFLTAFASYFDTAIDMLLMPALRVHDRGHPRMLVFELDFAKLAFGEAMSEDELRAECTRFMWAAVEEFFSRYASLLGVDPLAWTPFRDGGELPYVAVRTLALDHNRNIFLAVDNYTAPFLALATSFERRLAKDSFCYRVEYAIQRLILAPIFVDVGNHTIERGCITGDVLPNEPACLTLPFAESFGFTAYTEDLTAAPDCTHIIGFTRADIEELVRSFLGVADAEVAAVAEHVVPKQLERRVDPDTGSEAELEVVTYPSRVVAEALRSFKAAGEQADSEWDDALHLPASESTASSNLLTSAESREEMQRLLQTPADDSDTAMFASKE